MLENLIGYQLVSLDDSGFVVTKDGEFKHFEFNEDYGDCCGYNNICTTLFIDDNVLKNNPVITNIVIDNDNKEDNCDGEAITITFFGGDKMLSKIESESGSGSGWQYGATVTCKCVETKEEEILSSW